MLPTEMLRQRSSDEGIYGPLRPSLSIQIPNEKTLVEATARLGGQRSTKQLSFHSETPLVPPSSQESLARGAVYTAQAGRVSGQRYQTHGSLLSFNQTQFSQTQLPQPRQQARAQTPYQRTINEMERHQRSRSKRLSQIREGQMREQPRPGSSDLQQSGRPKY